MLTIDIGNTNFKWAVWEEGVMGKLNSRPHGMTFDAGLFDACLSGIAVNRVRICNVAGEVAALELRNWMSRNNFPEPEFFSVEVNPLELTHGYEIPVDHGADRWAAVYGANVDYGSPLCVIDCGTAITIDFLDVDKNHHGGAIISGFDAQKRCLLKNVAQVEMNEDGVRLERGLFARNTSQAITGGIIEVIVSSISDVIERILEEYGSETKILVTGGDAQNVAELLGYDLTVDPALVLKGLHCTATI